VELGFTRIHVRRERHKRVTQLLDRFLVYGPNRVYAKAESNDENSRSNHVSKVSKDLSVSFTKITDVSDDIVASLCRGAFLKDSVTEQRALWPLGPGCN